MPDTVESEAVPDVYEAKLQRNINLFIILSSSSLQTFPKINPSNKHLQLVQPVFLFVHALVMAEQSKYEPMTNEHQK